MRSHLRALASSALLSLAALTVAATAVFAGGASDKYSYTDEWCFNDVVVVYCFEVEGTVKLVEHESGDSMLKITDRTHTTVYQGGVVVAESWDVSKDKSAFVAGGQAHVKSRVHTTWTDGDVTCVTTMRLMIRNFEVVHDTIETSCN